MSKRKPVAAFTEMGDTNMGDTKIADADKLLRCAEDLLKLARRDLREQPAGGRLPAALWRLVDAAVLVAQLAPDADTGLRTFTGRGGRLELAVKGASDE